MKRYLVELEGIVEVDAEDDFEAEDTAMAMIYGEPLDLGKFNPELNVSVIDVKEV